MYNHCSSATYNVTLEGKTITLTDRLFIVVFLPILI